MPGQEAKNRMCILFSWEFLHSSSSAYGPTDGPPNSLWVLATVQRIVLNLMSHWLDSTWLLFWSYILLYSAVPCYLKNTFNIVEWFKMNKKPNLIIVKLLFSIIFVLSACMSSWRYSLYTHSIVEYMAKLTAWAGDKIQWNHSLRN